MALLRFVKACVNVPFFEIKELDKTKAKVAHVLFVLYILKFVVACVVMF